MYDSRYLGPRPPHLHENDGDLSEHTRNDGTERRRGGTFVILIDLCGHARTGPRISPPQRASGPTIWAAISPTNNGKKKKKRNGKDSSYRSSLLFISSSPPPFLYFCCVEGTEIFFSFRQSSTTSHCFPAIPAVATRRGAGGGQSLDLVSGVQGRIWSEAARLGWTDDIEAPSPHRHGRMLLRRGAPAPSHQETRSLPLSPRAPLCPSLSFYLLRDHNPLKAPFS